MDERHSKIQQRQNGVGCLCSYLARSRSTPIASPHSSRSLAGTGRKKPGPADADRSSLGSYYTGRCE
jgi:hypothetical protein